ncbi:phthiotriol/phenolphthiotriol dimycocerosates methyltransferase [Mycolicibacterium sediminis]|uniref:Phthiotriol/phenolphthiotriol dimycocerosates methyltransferase n=1 Tax=Mycolicibacterium sediminis TaxID=1286180 RepID=A0A7I7QSK0_9MYCO|nr:phthiotriol/phenolphthiotriol dimycocerosates methyltransferase [Mycolicibacterium sediminis]
MTTQASRPNIAHRIGGSSVFKKFMNGYWYPLLTRKLHGDDVVFLNYGYEEDPAMGIPLDADDEDNRYWIQMYHATATQVDLAGERVLEVSCGHGGGASYLMRTQRPASYTGLDFNAEGIEFCERRHQMPGLDFVHGDAEDLPMADGSIDAVVNIEASHAYGQLPRFLTEVARVLRPGGHFLYTDFRGRDEVPGWEATLADAPLRQLACREINGDVVRGMERNADRSLELIRRVLPSFLRPFGKQFAGVPGSGVYHDLETGKISYRIYLFTKD